MNSMEQGPNQVYDGVIVRSPWLQHDPRFTHGGPSGEVLKGNPGPTTMAKIRDGASKTFMIGEKYVRSDLHEGGSLSDDRGWADGWDPDTVRSTCYPPLSDGGGFQFQSSGVDDIFGHDKDVVYFGSSHPGVFNGVYADGSVHGVSYDIDVVVFNALATRAGAEITPE
jgi:hypothetical protein